MSSRFCPISLDVARIQTLSSDLTRTMRKLRRELDACRSCPMLDGCQTLHQFNTIVKECLLEIQAEWERE